MGTVTRGTKAAGGTEFSDATVAEAGEVNTDFNTLFNLVNGNLDNDNLKALAGLLLTKLDDASSTAANQKTTSDPGSSGSETLATDAQVELRQLRFAVERLALGVDANRNDGSSETAAWIDSPHRQGNLVVNPVFALQSGGSGAAPDGWSLSGTPTTAVVQATDASEGADAREVRIVADAADEGVQQTLDGPKADTLYLIVARVKVNSQNARLVTTGGASTGQFRNIDVSTSSSSFTTLLGVVQTDSSGTDLVIQILSNASGDDFDVASVLCFECSNHPTAAAGSVLQTEFDNLKSYTSGAGDTDWIPDSGNNPAIAVPGPGYAIEVLAYMSAQANTASSGTLKVTLHEDSGGGFSGVETSVITSAGSVSNLGGQVHFHHHVFPATSGSTYTYKLVGNASGVSFTANDARVTAKLVRL